MYRIKNKKMILELATIEIKAKQGAGFEAALVKAQEVLITAKGYIKHEFKKCIEQPNRYILLITWETLEDHTVGFRESDLFQRWRIIIGPYFDKAPVVQHFTAL
jgi:heme-degrading monooxygenase HmoA